MLVLKNRTVIEIYRGLQAFLNLDAGLTRAQMPESHPAAPTAADSQARKDLEQVRQRLHNKERELVRFRAESVRANGSGDQASGVKPQNMIWLFGSGRTGSSWLSAMMGDIKGHIRWNEPYVGEIFGTAYYIRAGDRMRARKDYALGDDHREARLRSIRSFVLEGANARFPEAAEGGYLIIKEPNGSLGAPLLMEAMPQSRMILLVRDPRDVVSSTLAAQKKGSWGDQWRAGGSGESLTDTNPDELVRRGAHSFMLNLGKAKEAYEAHESPKVVVRYEDLRTHTLETMKRLYYTLHVRVDEGELARVVEKHAWENIPAKKKGPDKPHRKAQPGGWREDLTVDQARAVETITTPILDEFYPGWLSSARG